MHLNAVASIVLGLTDGKLCTSLEVVLIRGGTNRETDTDPQPARDLVTIAVRVPFVELLDRSPEVFGETHRHRVVPCQQENEELITSEAEWDGPVMKSAPTLQRLGDGAERNVTNELPERRIHVLEVIDLDEEQREPNPTAALRFPSKLAQVRSNRMRSIEVGEAISSKDIEEIPAEIFSKLIETIVDRLETNLAESHAKS